MSDKSQEGVKKELLNCAAYDLIGLKYKKGNKPNPALTVGKQHLNYAGISLGAFAFALGDAAMRWEISFCMPDKIAVTGTAKIVFKKAAKENDALSAQAKIVNQEGRKIFTEAIISNQNNEIIAAMEGVFIILV